MTKKNYIVLLLVVFSGFLVFGFSENIKGPAIPRMQADFRLSELQIGLLLSINSLGYLLASMFTGWLSTKTGLKFVCLLAFGSMAVSGVFIYFSAGYTLFTLSYFLMYIGNGILEISLAILAARIFIRNTGTMMNLAHFFYGLSSMAAPFFASIMMGWHMFGAQLDWRGMYFIMLSLAVLPFAAAALPRFPRDERKSEDRISMKMFLRDRAAWLIVAVLSFGVVSELAIAGWLVNFLEKAYNWDTKASSGMLSAFFLFFMLARLVLGPVTDKIGYVKSLVVFAAASGVCSLAAVALGEPGAVLFALAGLGIAPIYPTVMALLAKRYPNGTENAITVTVTILGISVVIGNFLVGAITEWAKDGFTLLRDAQTGLVMGLQAGYVFIGLNAIACSVMAVFLHRYLKRKEQVL